MSPSRGRCQAEEVKHALEILQVLLEIVMEHMEVESHGVHHVFVIRNMAIQGAIVHFHDYFGECTCFRPVMFHFPGL